MIKNLSQSLLLAVLTLFYADTAFGQAAALAVEPVAAVEPTGPLTLAWWLGEGLIYLIIILVLIVVLAVYLVSKKKKQGAPPAESGEAEPEDVQPAEPAAEEPAAEGEAEPEAGAEEGEEEVVKPDEGR
jgi:flagellar biosynthesis/type III secretory pathway M-ring protein FliF/YscJ